MKLSNLHDLLIDQLRDIYFAEKQLVRALPKMAKASSSRDLRGAFESHLGETREHVARLEKAFQHLETPAKPKRCPAILGILEEGEGFAGPEGKQHDPAVRDAGLIASGQRAEHYEICAYGCARAYADQLGYTEVVGLLTRTIEEEGKANKALTGLAEGGINQAAQDGEHAEVKPANGTRARNGKAAKPRRTLANA